MFGLESLKNAFKLRDLRNRIYYVGLMFAIFILGLHIPVPNIDRAAMGRLFEQGGDFLGLLDVFSGGALRKFSIFAMSITPYINASIIFQLLGMASPTIQAWSKEGETGRRRIGLYTRYLTVALAMLQAWGMTGMLYKRGIVQVGSWIELLPMTVTLTAGTCFLMWLGEKITDKGIGNGVSLIIFAGIITRLPSEVMRTIDAVRVGANSITQVGLLVCFFVGTVMGVIYIQQGQRKIPVQHAKRVIGNRIYGGTSSFLPLRVNTAGVIPIIFAIAVQMFPFTLASFMPDWQWAAGLKEWTQRLAYPDQAWWAAVFYFLMVVGFTYFYTAVTFNVPEVADNLKRAGGYIPGIRPGKPTSDFLDRVLTRITLAGAVFLGLIALLQYFVPHITGVYSFRNLVGGTSILIVVGVALETIQQIETHLVMRHYEGFIK